MGIGYAITRDIAEMGGNVAVLDLRDEPLEDVHGLAKKFGVKISYHQADVSDEKSLRAAFDKAVQSLGQLDGIVTAAGIAIDKPYTDQGWEEVNKVIQVNVSVVIYTFRDILAESIHKSIGTFFSGQMAVQQMKKQGKGGSVVMIASITSHVNLPGYRMAGYNMSKGGVRMVKT